ncbi:hypothetical protein BJ508DRAFT_323411 [Ascobolus immersus RN42]|uniref:DUF7580 domain-containing protein n=1 Tax=Ascobolus immersus RN42 TaxID=1160509 RepID=A0A3N4IEC5_ASCIM|nr:hypothetical protein BJ508DRAFT_323411 [Ascobolus immersus RN42]
MRPKVQNENRVLCTDIDVDAFFRSRPESLALQVKIQYFEGFQEILKPEFVPLSYNSLAHYKGAAQLETLETIFNKPRPTIAACRRLALFLAEALLLFCENVLPSKDWDKDCIQFVVDESGYPDLERPYIDIAFDKSLRAAEEDATLPPNTRNLGLSRLGILLIEVHQWRPITSYRQSTDHLQMVDLPDVAADIATAKRLLETSLNNCTPSYKKCIEMCLTPPWAAMDELSLENESVREGIYEDIIVPLQMEIDFLEQA